MKNLTRPQRVGKKSSTFGCFYWLISSALARWFQKCIHVHSKYCSKWVKNVKNLRESTILGKLQVPGGFSHFWPTCNNICYGHVYIFGISAPRRCWWANKNAKKLNFFFDPHGGECKSENVDFGQLKSIFWPWARKAKLIFRSKCMKKTPRVLVLSLFLYDTAP